MWPDEYWLAPTRVSGLLLPPLLVPWPAACVVIQTQPEQPALPCLSACQQAPNLTLAVPMSPLADGSPLLSPEAGQTYKQLHCTAFCAVLSTGRIL